MYDPVLPPTVCCCLWWRAIYIISFHYGSTAAGVVIQAEWWPITTVPIIITRNGIGDNAVTAYGNVTIVWNAIAVWKATFYSQNSHVRFAVVSTYILKINYWKIKIYYPHIFIIGIIIINNISIIIVIIIIIILSSKLSQDGFLSYKCILLQRDLFFIITPALLLLIA